MIRKTFIRNARGDIARIIEFDETSGNTTVRYVERDREGNIVGSRDVVQPALKPLPTPEPSPLTRMKAADRVRRYGRFGG